MKIADILETRKASFNFIKSILPLWPEYVLRDWIYNLARGVHGVGSADTPPDDPNFNWGFDSDLILRVINNEGLTPETKWTLVLNFEFKMDKLTPDTQERLKARAGGELNPYQVPNDAARHSKQAELAKKQGGIRKEPVILIKHANGYDLMEGWHRTIQHFKMYPEGYTGPAWIAVAQNTTNESTDKFEYTTEKQILIRIRQILYDRKLSGTESNAGELHMLRRKLKDIRNKKGVAEGATQKQGQVRQTLNAWMNKDQQYKDPTQREGFQAKVWPYIQKNIKTILADKGEKGNGDYPAAPYAAWLLVQHMDAYPQNQIEFYNALKQAIPDHPKIQFLKDRAAVNQWIMKNANNPKYFINGKALPNPTVNVRNPAIFKDAGIVATSREEALSNAEQAGNKLLVAAVTATNAQTQPSYKQSANEGQQGVAENFADGKGPGRPGDSQRHGIPKGATMAQLTKAAKAPGRKGQLARWQLNMRRGRKRAKQ